MSPSDSEKENCLKEVAIGIARSLSTLRLTNTITISDDSESGSDNDSDNNEMIFSYTISLEKNHICRFIASDFSNGIVSIRICAKESDLG